MFDDNTDVYAFMASIVDRVWYVLQGIGIAASAVALLLFIA